MSARILSVNPPYYDPPTIYAAVGDTITWTNIDTAALHTVTALDATFDSGILVAGATWSYTTTRAGTFPYVGDLHSGMQATLVVSAGGTTPAPTATAAPATTPTPTSIPTSTPIPTAQPPAATPQSTATPTPAPPPATASPQPPPASQTRGDDGEHDDDD